jgi:predicted small lipoprotein YifL
MTTANRLLLFVCILLTTLLLAACGQAAPETLPPEEIVTRSAAQMKSLDSFHFVIDRSGAPAYLDTQETLSFSRAEGDFVAPDRAYADIRIIAPGLVAEISIVGIGESYWETNLLTGQWQELPAGTGFNPAVLFDPVIGFQPVLESDLSDLQLVGIEELAELPGQQMYTITGRIAGERLFSMSYEMIGPETMDVQLWIAPETFELYRAIIIEPTSNPSEPTIWQLDFWDFNTPVTIDPPPLTP